MGAGNTFAQATVRLEERSVDYDAAEVHIFAGRG